VGQEEIIKYLDLTDKDLLFLQLRDENWKNDQEFLADGLKHFNKINLIL
jgi:hypothetical protein